MPGVLLVDIGDWSRLQSFKGPVAFSLLLNAFFYSLVLELEMPPPTAGIDISSAPEPQEAIVTCDRRLCFLCSDDPARVVHLVARKPGGQVSETSCFSQIV